MPYRSEQQPYRSVPMESLLREAQELADQGVKELILVAQETTVYGRDLYGHKALPELLERLCRIEGLVWIRILYCYPEEIDDALIQVIRKEEKICHYLDIPIQHASDSILKRMGRRTDQRELTNMVNKLRCEIPDICLRTTLIAGFPGETEEEFRETEAFVRKVNFYEMHIFKYSRRQGTRAAMMEGQLTEAEKGRRSAVLAQAEEEMSRSYRAGWLNRETGVLFEEKKQVAGGTYWIGHTPQYVKVAMEAGENADLSGKIVRGTPVGFLHGRYPAFKVIEFCVAMGYYGNIRSVISTKTMDKGVE